MSRVPSPYTTLYVEFWNGHEWDLWRECEEACDAKEEAEILEERGFKWRVRNKDLNQVDL